MVASAFLRSVRGLLSSKCQRRLGIATEAFQASVGVSGREDCSGWLYLGSIVDLDRFHAEYKLESE